jgi:hypothetical protein
MMDGVMACGPGAIVSHEALRFGNLAEQQTLLKRL